MLQQFLFTLGTLHRYNAQKGTQKGNRKIEKCRNREVEKLKNTEIEKKMQSRNISKNLAFKTRHLRILYASKKYDFYLYNLIEKVIHSYKNNSTFHFSIFVF